MEELTFGKLIEKLRKEKDWTIQEFAEIADLSNVEISNIENDKHKPRPSTIRKLAIALDYDYSKLYDASRIKK